MAEDNSIILKSVALGGYRSFGKQVQRFERFAKINLLIGQNNSGKSNVLSFLHKVYPKLSDPISFKLGPLDRHIPSKADFTVGLSLSLRKDDEGNYPEIEEKIASLSPDLNNETWLRDHLLTILKEKASKDNTDDSWFDFLPSKRNSGLVESNIWRDAFGILQPNELEKVWNTLTDTSGGSWDRNWFPETLRILAPEFLSVDSNMIPAIRQVGTQGSESDNFSGLGIIERLAKIQNPDVHNQLDKDKFNAINHFLQTVTDNRNALIEIPHERDTILFQMDGKTLPLESIGTGIHEVIILAAAATICDNSIICMEEPELHLNPLLQKKLVRYLADSTTNQYFISTHSAALMDTPEAEIYHIRLEDGESTVERVTSDSHKSSVCEDLGYHPSDLLQANCVIWVEGPSDRIYLNYWINAKDPKYIEGIHYSIMFYGGKLASHLSGKDMDEIDGTMDDFISLRRLCRRGTIVMDSDRKEGEDEINATKKRLRDEFDNEQGHVWITDGREIENYLPEEYVKQAIAKTIPSATISGSFGCYDKVLSITTKGGKETQAPKVEVARYIGCNLEPDFSILDLDTQVSKLVEFIHSSNEPGLDMNI